MKRFINVSLLLLIIFACSCTKAPVQPLVNTTQPVKLQSISLTADTITLNVGDQYNLGVKLNPANAVDTVLTFNSSDPSTVAVAKPGIVKALKPGSAIITLSNSTSTVTKSCLVNVSSIGILSLKLNKTALTIAVGQKDTLTAIIVPANATTKTLVWSSSNTTVATVDSNGIVTGKLSGGAIITAKTIDGKLSASCNVTVSPTIATGIVIKSALTIVVGQQDSLKVVVQPAGSVYPKLFWSSSNTAVAIVNSVGVITAKTIGNTTITVKTADSKLFATSQITVTTDHLTGFKLDSTEVLLLAGSSVKMGYTLTPASVLNKQVTWTTDNSSIATVQPDGTINAIAKGTCNLTATATEGNLSVKIPVYVVDLDFDIEAFINYEATTVSGEPGENVSYKLINYTVFDLQIVKYDIYNLENVHLDSVSDPAGNPVLTIPPAAIGTDPPQSFIIGQADPGHTGILHWTVVVHFYLDGYLSNKRYKMTLNFGGVGELAKKTIVQE
jgi:uncharacterized protein YjdB